MKKEDIRSMVVQSMSGSTDYLLDIMDFVAYFIYCDTDTSHLAPVLSMAGLYLDLVLQFNPVGYGDDGLNYWEVLNREDLNMILEKHCFGIGQLFIMKEHGKPPEQSIMVRETLNRVHQMNLAVENTVVGEIFPIENCNAKISSADTVFSGLSRILDLKDEAVLVSDEKNADEIVGVLTGYCLLDMLDIEGTWPTKLHNTQVKAVMHTDCPIIKLSTSFGELVSKLANGTRRYAIVKEGNNSRLISRVQCLNVFRQFLLDEPISSQ